MKKTKFKSSAQYRNIELDMMKNSDPVEQVVDEESRTITFPFSSEEPVIREYFDTEAGEVIRAYEVLDHNSEINLDRLKQAGSLLVNHDRNDVVGVVEDATIENGRGMVTVRFGKSERANEIFNDVKDKIRRTVSFGYRVLDAVRQDNEDRDLPTMLISWEPFEVSLETVPADITVGVGRNKDEDYENEFIVRSEETNEPEEQHVPKVTVKERNNMDKTFDEGAQSGIKAERKRINAISKIADNVRHMLPEVNALAETFKDSERTVDEFNAAIVGEINTLKREDVVTAGRGELELEPQEVQQFSLMRMATALSTGNWKDAGFELEVSRAQADVQGMEARGAFVPLSVLSARADGALTSSAANGTSLIATDYWGSDYIDILRATSVVAAMGARIIPGLVGDVDIPKGLNGAAFSWLAEGDDNDANTYTASTVSLSPQDIGGAVGFTRKMQKQTGNPAIENLLRNDLNIGIGTFLDQQVLVGTQAGASGLTTTAAGGSAITAVTHGSIVDLEADVATANAEAGALGYVCSPFVRGVMKQKVKDASGAGAFLMDSDGSVNGHKCMITTLAAANLFYGNWNDILLPMWGGVDIVVDAATNIASGGIVLRAFLSTDIALRNAESFAVQSTIAG